MISLQPITHENLRDVLRLEVAPEQQGFVATNGVSIAQCYLEREWVPLAVHLDQTPIGFILHTREADTGIDWIIRFMIAAPYQGQGYGRQALQLMITQIATQPAAREIRLSYVPGNQHAVALYHSLGFVETGEIEDDEVIMALPVVGSNLSVTETN